MHHSDTAKKKKTQKNKDSTTIEATAALSQKKKRGKQQSMKRSYQEGNELMKSLLFTIEVVTSDTRASILAV